LCARPGCGAAATATLRFQPTLRQAWLVDLDEATARTQGDLCRRHAAALVLPRGWELHDQRTSGPRLVEDTSIGNGSTGNGATARRVRVRRRAPEHEPQREPEPPPDQLPGFEPVVVSNGNGEATAKRTVPAQFGANDGDDSDVDDEALNTILDARTPLLQRAFRNAKPGA
jgi:hypothetical protein